MSKQINLGLFGALGWAILILLLAYTESYAFDEGEIEAAVYCGDLIIYVIMFSMFVVDCYAFRNHKQRITDLQLQVEELQERLDDIDGIVNHVKLSVNPRYIGQDTSRPSAPEAQDDGRDAEDHAA